MQSDRSGEVSPVGAAAMRHTLLRRRRELAAELDVARAALVELRHQRSDRVDDDEHDPDGSPLSAEWSRLDGLRRVTEQRITDVEMALENLAAGRFGVCQRCGTTIPPDRLEIRPTATLCVRCASR